MTRLAISVLLIRVVQSEAGGAVGFLQAIGLNNDQMQTLWLVALAGCTLGILSSALIITPQRLQPMLMFALALMAVGAWIDSQATSLTRPEQMYFSQFLLAFSGTFSWGRSSCRALGP